MSELQIVRRETVEDIKAAVDELRGGGGALGGEKLANAIRAGIVPKADGVKFAEASDDLQNRWQVTQGWIGQLVSICREMAGSPARLTPEQIITELRRVIFMPQGRAVTIVSSLGRFSGTAEGRLPEYERRAITSIVTALGEFLSTARETEE